MVATSAAGVAWIWLLLAGAAGGISTGGAPLELDPKLAAVAPEECLWYVSYSGQKSADPDSANETEKLFAEPQVQKFVEEVQTQVMRAVRLAGGPGQKQRVLAAELPKLVKALFLRPSAAYIEELKPTEEGESVSIEAAIVLNAGDQRADVEAAIGELLKLGQQQGLAVTDSSSDGVKWRQVQLPPKAPEVRFGWQGDYFIICVGTDTPEKIVQRMDGSAPKWLDEIRNRRQVARELSLGYLNVAGILERGRPVLEHHHPQAWPAIERLGLTSIVALEGVNGYDEKGSISVGQVVTDGKRPGLLSLVAHEPLETADLEVIPKDALIAAAARLDPAEFWDNLTKLVVAFHPEAQDKIDKGLWEVETHLRVNVREDIVESLGDVWVAYLPGGDLFTSWFNTAAAVRVDDEQKLREAAGRLVDAAKAEMARHQNRATIVESTIEAAGGEHTVMTLQFEEPVPVAPSWCITDKWVVFALQPQAIRALLDRDAKDSLAQSDAVQEAIGKGPGPSALVYQDTPQLVRSVYPFVQMGVQMLSGQLRRQGIEIDATSLPSSETIVKHLRPSVSTMTYQDDGFHFKSLTSLPSGGSVGAAPVLAALVLPAAAKARMAAHTAQDTNNMKQIALACMIYHDVHRSFPTDIYDKDGKPLLSWRVQLLPYLEQQALYDQFHRDEPWDSPHNLPLTQQLPPTFASTGDGSQSGKTRYLGLKGDGTVFRGQEPVRLQQITDGTSRTLLVVQAEPDHAVEWTKPADIDYDADKPFAGLDSTGEPRGMFLGALCDGSVHRLSLAIDKATMQALASRAGEEEVDYNVLSMPPGQHNYGADGIEVIKK